MRQKATRQVWLIEMLIKQHVWCTVVLGFTIIGHFKMCSCITQQKTKNALFEGVYSWHTDYRNVLQSCLRCHFFEFRSILNQPQNWFPDKLS